MKKTALLVVLLLVVVACSGSDSESDVASLEGTDVAADEGPTAEDLETDSEEAILAFAQCMRDNGVPEFPDPTVDANGNLNLFRGGNGPGGLGVDQSTLQAAFEECSPLVEDLFQNFLNQDQSEFQDNFLEFATCMREQGIDMPDPDFSGGFGSGGRGGLFGDIDPNDPEFQAAAEECQSIFEGGSGFGGRRFGGEGGDD